jgi:hypothetical protein
MSTRPKGVRLVRPLLRFSFGRTFTDRNFNVKSNPVEVNQTFEPLFSYLSDLGEIMGYKREDIETLRLLRAFYRIRDPAKRREILELVENAASPKPDETSR